MDNTQKFQKAYDYAKQNPNTPYATELRKRIEAGDYNKEIKTLGLNPQVPGSAVSGVLEGIGKGAGQLAIGLGTVGQKALDIQSNVIDKVMGVPTEGGIFKSRIKDKLFTGNDIFRGGTEQNKEVTQNLQAEGTAEKAGKTIFDVGAIFAQPEVAVDKIGLNGIEMLAEKGLISPGTFTKIAGAIESKFGQAGLKSVARFVEGTGYGTTQAAGAGSDNPLKEGLVTGAVNIVAAPVAGLISKGVKNIPKIPGAVDDALSKVATKIKPNTTVLDIVTPVLSKTEKEAAVAAGRAEKSGILGTVTLKPDKRLLDTVDSVKDIVKTDKTIVENINLVKKGISDEAEQLKTQIGEIDHPYTFKELSAKLSNVEEPISIKGTAFERQIKAVKKAAIDIARTNKGNVSGLLDSRKQFDALVEKEYPNLYDRENAPMRNAITAIRSAMNDFIEKELPSDVGFRESLKKQSLMYNALENMNTKSAQEIGSNVVTRTLRKNPRTTRALKYGATAVAGGGITGAIIN